MPCGVSGTTWEIRGALVPLANCSSARARRTTRTCCTPPLSSFASSFWSLGVTLILRGGRPIPEYAPEQFCIKMVFTIFLGGQGPSVVFVADIEFLLGPLLPAFVVAR